VYLVLSGLARFLVEFLRINPRGLWGLSEAQLISLAVVLVGSGAGFGLLKEKAV
jgi:phosphatidylglycerol:prolipoprotein diacylglycerol transferase